MLRYYPSGCFKYGKFVQNQAEGKVIKYEKDGKIKEYIYQKGKQIGKSKIL